MNLPPFSEVQPFLCHTCQHSHRLQPRTTAEDFESFFFFQTCSSEFFRKRCETVKHRFFFQTVLVPDWYECLHPFGHLLWLVLHSVWTVDCLGPERVYLDVGTEKIDRKIDSDR